MTMSCINCGGDMWGDGYNSVMQCENSEEDTSFHEPDAGPIYCDYEEPPIQNDWGNYCWGVNCLITHHRNQQVIDDYFMRFKGELLVDVSDTLEVNKT